MKTPKPTPVRFLAGRAFVVAVLWGLALILSVGRPCRAQAQDPSHSLPGQTGKFVVTLLEMDHDLPGWGLAIVLQTPGGRTYLYDTGRSASSPDDFRAGRDVIAPFLEKQDIDTIEGIVVSHPHKDHFGGTEYLLNHFNVKQLIDSGYMGGSNADMYKDVLQQVKQPGGCEYKAVQAGDALDWGKDLQVEVLSPPKEFLGGGSYEIPEDDPEGHHLPNLNSLVLRIQHGENVFLFPGDLTSSGQDHLLEQVRKDRLHTDILVAPGHGNASYLPFAKVAEPEIVLVGCRTNLSTPASKAKTIYEQTGATVYATCWHGRLQVVSDSESHTVRIERSPLSDTD